MSLTSALGIAQRSLQNTSRQTSVVSRNIAEQGNADYTRRTAVLASTGGSGARVADIQRSTSEVLFKQNLAALSSASGQQALLNGLNQLATAVNGASNNATVSAAFGDLQEALALYSASPANRTLALNAVEAARNLVSSLNNATQAVQTFRADADKQMATAVGDLNTMLAEFQELNATIVNGTRLGTDVNEALDRRDALLKQISEIVPVSAHKRADNDISLITKDGITLFDKVPRKVAFTPTTVYDASLGGNPIYIDGVALSQGRTAESPGTLGALLHLRDAVAPTMQNQLDDMARAVVTAFSEAGSTGLVNWAGSGTMASAGFAGMIRIDAAYDVNAGGNPELLRGAGTAASDGTRIQAFVSRLDEPVAFSAASGLGTAAMSLGDFASSSVGWLEAQRRTASGALETAGALATRTAAALSNATGVNMDEEMALLLELEHSYQASARLIRAVDEMLTALLAAVN
ncbi:MAG TPA: flagellar hook-associated protein FlgK [Tianweitania sediminis]|jgi:flagellar hook-associated protein 1 FlgK|nr:flagellar hook-associated protein FlgK [Tianweitania sediminis]